MNRVLCWLIVIPALVVASPANAQNESAQDINAPFNDKNLDLKGFIERFESETREVFAKREAIAEAVGVEPGMAVADIGAGTGVFTRLLAAKVGPAGRVYAVDIAPAFLEHIAREAEKQGHKDIVATIRGTQESTRLGSRSVDLAFICDTYHHFEKPEPVLASIHRALRPGGRLVVIDLDKRDDASDFVKRHARAPKEVYFREIEAAGFERVTDAKAPELKETFFAVFKKVPKPTPAPAPPANP